jgi:ATP-dependent DNA ligase
VAILVEPMLARLVRTLPEGGYRYEPKWDGFRAVVARAGGRVEMISRHGRPLARYFPELVEAVLRLDDEDVTIDGEIVLGTERGFDFAALMTRLHPAESRVRRLSAETPASFVAFDLLWRAGTDLRPMPFDERRRQLEEVLRAPPLRMAPTPITDDVEEARAWLSTPPGSGIDGVVAKDRSAPYEPGRRSVIKVKSRRTLDAVVAGYRWMMDRPVIGSLLLGLYDDRGELRHIGVASSLSEKQRERFLEELSPLAIRLEDHPWAEGFPIEASPLGRLKGAAGRWTPNMAMDWVPIRLERVAEVEYDRFDGDRLRHAARFIRWRPDREAWSCTFDQIERTKEVQSRPASRQAP